MSQYMTHCPGCGETFGVQVPPASVRESGLMAERDRYREALLSILINLDGENEDGNIFPAAALRIAREALVPERREQSS